MKTKEELNALKEEVETVSRKLAELDEDELAEVTGGTAADVKNYLDGILNPSWAYGDSSIRKVPSINDMINQEREN